MDRQSNKITALYCRMARYIPGVDELTRNSQMEALSQYAESHRLENPRFFCDWGVSGITADRPEYLRMLQEVEAGNISNLVVLNLSRLSRDYITCWELIESLLLQHGVILHSVQDGNGITEFMQVRHEVMRLYAMHRKGGRA